MLFKVCLVFPGLKIGFLSSVLRRYHFPVTRYPWLKSIGNYLIKPQGIPPLPSPWHVSLHCGALRPGQPAARHCSCVAQRGNKLAERGG